MSAGAIGVLQQQICEEDLMSDVRHFDIVLFGATGYTGGLIARYLAERCTHTPFRWAIAGRSKTKLERVRRALQDAFPDLPPLGLILADSQRPDSLKHMAARCQVVLSAVGPYMQHGEALVQSCIAARCDYVDLCGEPEFVDLLLSQHDQQAADAGVRIVNCCGFDSIPHDLGVYFALRHLTEGLSQARARRANIKVNGFVRFHGNFSGGTLNSALTAFSRLSENAAMARRRQRLLRQRGMDAGRRIRAARPSAGYKRDYEAWACPLPTIDNQVIQRSAQLIPEYGTEFSYGHYLLVKKLPRLLGGVAAVGGLIALSQLRFTREWLQSLREPGEGPSEDDRRQGWFIATFEASMVNRRVRVQVSGGDPGYGETAKIIAEAALCLALDRSRLSRVSGIVTPAAVMAEPLIERLQAAGMPFKLLP